MSVIEDGVEWCEQCARFPSLSDASQLMLQMLTSEVRWWIVWDRVEAWELLLE